MIQAEGTEAQAGGTDSPVLRIWAKVVSILFHPLFVPVYVGWFFIYILRLFPEADAWAKTKLMISFTVNYALLPLVTILLAKALGFVESIYLRTSRDRIIPYVASGVFYFWIWYVFKNQDFPKEVVMFSLAIFLASSLGLILNSYLKISMHTISAGVVATLFIILGLRAEINMGPYLSIVLLLTGMVSSARLVNADHTPREVYAGLIVGALAQVVAFFFV